MRLQLVLAFAIATGASALAQSSLADSVPWPRGVYLRSGNDWVSLPVNPLLPIMNGSARWLLGFGQSDAVAELPGPHALVQTGNAKPMFYLRGMPNGIRLIRTDQKDDYRMIRMPVTRDFRQFTKFRAQDTIELDVRGVSGDVVSATPKADLKPGEYAIVGAFEQSQRQIRASFEFGVR